MAYVPKQGERAVYVVEASTQGAQPVYGPFVQTDGGLAKVDSLGTGTADATTFLRGDRTWAVPPSTGGSAWGDITGTLADQTDLGAALDAKAAASHTHAAADVVGTAVLTDDARLSDARTPLAHAHTASDVTGTAVLTADARLSDARTPTAHATSHTTGADKIATGTPDGSKFLRDDYSWQTLPASGAAWGGITGTLSNQTDLQTALDAKQATLVSGTNIKTINGSTVLGSGDLVVAGVAGDFDSVLTGSSTIAANKVRTIGGWLSISDGGGILVIEDMGALALV